MLRRQLQDTAGGAGLGLGPDQVLLPDAESILGRGGFAENSFLRRCDLTPTGHVAIAPSFALLAPTTSWPAAPAGELQKPCQTAEKQSQKKYSSSYSMV
ncbi:hypothetical protein I6F07_11225 [Ensifer sp. IC4062]|nr:hypothetical protein [Ensifer sp. IC4062]MCA1440778.1 hypothetical protein [Ensifer sp. IC4062]